MNSALKWGVVIGVLSLLWHVLEKFTGFDSDFIEYHTKAGIFFLVPFVMIYVLALLQKRNENGGTLTYMDGLKHALYIAILSIPFVMLATFIKIKMISPDFQTNMIDFLITTGAEQSDVESAFSDMGILSSSALFSMFGVVAGALAMIFIKKD